MRDGPPAPFGGAEAVRVLPDVAGFERELDYAVPETMAGGLRAGSVVRVPLQARRARAWVLAYPVRPPEGMALRPLAGVLGWGPEASVLDLAGWAGWRWAGRRRSVLTTATSATLVKALPSPRLEWRSRPPGAASHVAGGDGDGPWPSVVAEALAGTHLLRCAPAEGATGLVEAAARRGPVLVVAPSTGRAEAGAAALRARGIPVALVPGDWPQARAGSAVVIGARAAVWAPCPGMASVVVLDAHDEAHHQEQAPTWDAPTVAARRAADAGVPCFWVSACPTLELLVAADEVHTGGAVRERSGWAPLDVVDLRLEDPRSGLFPQALVERLHRGGGRVVCVLNRKGRAQLLDCAACREVARCEQCSSAVALDGDLLVCRRCGTSRPQVCASCGSTALRLLKVGISRAREQLEALAGSDVGEVSAGSGPLPDAPVLVGTEAVLHRAGELARGARVGAVVFLDFDQELLAPRYRAGEQALALLARASRLLGGRGHGGRIVVQTRMPEHPVIMAAASGDPARLAAWEEPLRRDLRLPPFSALALLSGPGAAELVERLGANGAVAAAGLPAVGLPVAAGQAAGLPVAGVPGPGLPAGAGMVEVVAAAPGTWLVRAPDHAALADALAAAGRPAQRVRVEVGPPRL